jgi:hypothetical protein
MVDPLRVRAALVEARTGLINTARGLAKSLGERLPICDTDQMGVEQTESPRTELQQVLEPLHGSRRQTVRNSFPLLPTTLLPTTLLPISQNSAELLLASYSRSRDLGAKTLISPHLVANSLKSRSYPAIRTLNGRYAEPRSFILGAVISAEMWER